MRFACWQVDDNDSAGSAVSHIGGVCPIVKANIIYITGRLDHIWTEGNHAHDFVRVQIDLHQLWSVWHHGREERRRGIHDP